MTSPSGTFTIYTGRVTNWPMIWLSAALLVPFLWMGAQSQGAWSELILPLGFIGLAFVVTLLTATSLRANAGPKGVTVYFGLFGWPRFRYPRERIVRAEVIQVPARTSNWGVFWSPRRGLRLTLRSGPALQLVLDNGRRVTINVPEPAAAVAALDAD